MDCPTDVTVPGILDGNDRLGLGVEATDPHIAGKCGTGLLPIEMIGRNMTDKSRTFCNAVQNRLATLDSRVRAMTLNAGPILQVKLDEVRMSGDANRRAVQQAREMVQQWCREKESEKKSTIDTWKESRESKKLGDRAQRAEDHAAYAIQIVAASIDDAERMILEAISARLDASIGDDSCSDVGNWYGYKGDSRHR